MDTDVTMVPARQGSAAASSSSSSTKKPKRFEIKKWNAVALWTWGIISWIYALNANLIKLGPQVRSALLLGVCAIMPSISIASADGSKPVKFAPCEWEFQKYGH